MQVGPLIELSENPFEEVAEMARGMYIDLLKIEFKATATFSKVGERLSCQPNFAATS